jgi:formylglycine-generating enzyme required for sulfatase activity
VPDFADYLTITTQPEEVNVYLTRYAPEKTDKLNQREFIGLTPINSLRIIRGGYKVYLEKEGFEPTERVISSNFRLELPIKRSPEIKIEFNLLGKDKIIEKMVFIPRGNYQLVAWESPTSAEVQLDDYYIDKYEVSNLDYKAFIETGGYQNRQYWSHPFIKDGKELSWKDAMELFKDRTGLHGPRDWIDQEFPEGRGYYPVTNITWYEATAYAQFMNKKLPTLFQWEKAARDGRRSVEVIVMPWGKANPYEDIEMRANFEGTNTKPVNSLEFGISPYGCYNMAGNVKEWCLNEMTGGFASTGGSWEDPYYMFATFGNFPGFFSSSSLGFRCVHTPAASSGDQGAMKINLDKQTPTYVPVNDETYKTFLSHYKYDKKPLNAQIIKTITPDWIKETVSFSGIDNKLLIAYLYLPTRAKKPFQCINFVPHSGVISGLMRMDEATEHFVGSQIKSGRAVLAVVPKGARERELPASFVWPDIESVKYREMVIQYATEFSLGLDYLATRDDIDMQRLAFLGVSWGASEDGIIFAAVEERYSSVIFLGGGMESYDPLKLPEVNPINFVPRIKAPKLLLNGRYDETFQLETHARPLYNLMKEPKQFSLIESGHVPLLELRVPIINKWLDETLGPVVFE